MILCDTDKLYSFFRVDVRVRAKSQMFLESYGGDGCDFDDESDDENNAFDAFHGDGNEEEE